MTGRTEGIFSKRLEHRPFAELMGSLKPSFMSIEINGYDGVSALVNFETVAEELDPPPREIVGVISGVPKILCFVSGAFSVIDLIKPMGNVADYETNLGMLIPLKLVEQNMGQLGHSFSQTCENL